MEETVGKSYDYSGHMHRKSGRYVQELPDFIDLKEKPNLTHKTFQALSIAKDSIESTEPFSEWSSSSSSRSNFISLIFARETIVFSRG